MTMTPQNKILDKRNFQRIKCMKYAEMVRFITNIYQSGFRDGQADSSGLNEMDVRDLLMSIRGIGPKRCSQIMEAMNVRLDEEQSLYYPCGHCGHDLAHVRGAKFCPECGSKLNWEE